MTWHKPNKFLTGILVLFFLALRFSATAHAIEYGKISHEHDGTVCALSVVLEDELDDILPAPKPTALPLPPSKNSYVIDIYAHPTPSTDISICARGPPTP